VGIAIYRADCSGNKSSQTTFISFFLAQDWD
jgi:hypothetical protein